MTDEELEDLAYANANYEPLRERLIALFKEVRDAERERAARLARYYLDPQYSRCEALVTAIRSGVDPDGTD